MSDDTDADGRVSPLASPPWSKREGTRAGPVLHLAAVAVPVLGVALAAVAHAPWHLVALASLALAFTVSAAALDARAHALVVGAAAVGAAVVGATGPTPVASLVLLLTTVLVGAAAGARAQAHATARTVLQHRSDEATHYSAALRAVVDAAGGTTTSDRQEILDTVVRATERIESDLAGIYLLTEDGLLRYGATWNVPEELTNETFSADEGLAGRALRERRTIVTNDYLEYDGGMPSYRDHGLRAGIGTPIEIAGQVAGVLVAGRYRTGGYHPAAVAAIELLAAHAGRAITLAEAIDHDRSTLEQLRALHALQEDFVATVSHELRTPLTVVEGLADTLHRLQDELEPGPRRELLDRMRANAASLSSIVTSLLEAAKLDRGLVELEAHDVDLAFTVRRCAERLAPVLAEHEVVLDLDPAVARGDAALLERVIDNLLTNAERHTPAGTTVTATVRAEGVRCVVTVADDGPGIPPRDLALVTRRFTRGGDHRTRSTRGLGLGLALVDQVLRLHGTTLEVRSPPGEGASFSFSLPRAR